MRLKVSIFFIVALITGWVLYFNLRPNNFLLVLNFKQPTPVSPIYYLKRTREQIQSQFIFGDRDKTEWYFTLSQKRLSEARNLCLANLTKLGKSQVLLARSYFNKGTLSLNNLIGKTDTNYLSGEKSKTEEMLKSTCAN